MSIAKVVAVRSTCDRKAVGAVLVHNNRILSTGYNGAPGGLPHCDVTNHAMVDGHCTTAVHAEVNAIAQAARYGVSIDGSYLYITASPCWSCFKVIATAGIRGVAYAEEYRPDSAVNDAARLLGIQVHCMYEAPKDG